MTQVDHILNAFRLNNYRITLGYALGYPWGYKLTSRLSDLRKQGYRVDFFPGKTPSENSWVLHVPEKNGQQTFI